MRPRIRTGYNYRGRPSGTIAPVLALGCEGETEEQYLQFMGRGRRIRIRPKVFTGGHGNALVDETLDYAQQQNTKYVDAIVIPAVVYDIERVSDSNLAAVRATVMYANSKNVKIWVNVPTIERWFALHYVNVSMYRSLRQAEIELNKAMSHLGLPDYRKPGSTQFYTNLLPRTESAVSNCARTHIDEMNNKDIPCLCDFVDFLHAY